MGLHNLLPYRLAVDKVFRVPSPSQRERQGQWGEVVKRERQGLRGLDQR